jgi:hypothetical protein
MAVKLSCKRKLDFDDIVVEASIEASIDASTEELMLTPPTSPLRFPALKRESGIVTDTQDQFASPLRNPPQNSPQTPSPFWLGQPADKTVASYLNNTSSPLSQKWIMEEGRDYLPSGLQFQIQTPNSSP